ncbi:hypothetical protein Tco_0946141 [Tanacetum coccineum]
MSSASSAVTYTSVYTDSEPWRFYWGVYRYDGLPMHLHPPSPVYVPYVPEPKYLKYLVPSDGEAPIEDQPLPVDASPTALSLGYVADSYPEEDLEEDLKEDHANYPVDGGDGNDEPSDDDDDDDEADDEDEEASEDEDDDEEKQLALADSSAVPIVDPVPSTKDIEAFETNESAPTPPSPPRSPQTKTDIPEAEMSPRKRACFTTPSSRFEVGESSAAGAMRQLGPTLEADLRRDRVREMGYGIIDTWDEIDTDEFYVRFEDAQDERAFLRARVNTLFRDKPYYRRTAILLNREATYARREWASFEDRSAAIETHVRTLEAHVATLMAHTSSLQTQLTTSLGRIETLEDRDLEPQDEPAEAAVAVSLVSLALIARGVDAALAECDADRSRNGDDSHDLRISGRRQVSTVRECTYTDFLKYQPMNFKGTEGVLGLSDMMFHMMFPEESDEIEKYVGGLPDMIHGSVMASKPKTMQEAIEFATELMDKKILIIAERQAKNKMKFEDTSRNNQN